MKLKDYAFVSVQVVLFAAYLFNVDFFAFKVPNIISILAFVVSALGFLIIILSILQLNKNLSPFPTPKSNSQLIESGLYKFVRHPIYTGILFLFYGYALYSTSFYKLLITTLLLVLFYLKSRYEERLLSQKFKAYIHYKKRTGRFIPYL